MSILEANSQRESLVSEAERADFVHAVLAGHLRPDDTTVSYHFEGWLDKDVVDAVLEVSSDPIEAVSALAGMYPPTPTFAAAESSGDKTNFGYDGDDHRSFTTPDGSVSAVASAATPPPESAAKRVNKTHARTFKAIQAQRGPPSHLISPAPLAAAEDESVDLSEAAATAAAAAAAAALASERAGSSAAGGGDGGGDGDMERVAAFIARYAGEKEAAAKAAAPTPSKPTNSSFSVPRGMPTPSTRKVQLAIAKTAEKAVELPGFEAFMKMQHGKDSLFRFLEVDHALHSYYLLAKKQVYDVVAKGGKGRGAAVAADPDKNASATKGGKAQDPDVAEIMRMLGGADP